MSDKNNNIDSSNIFDEFVDDTNLIEEVDKLKNEKNRDIFFYLSKAGHFFQISFFIILFLLVLLFSYIWIQNNEKLSNSNILDPICFLILWDIDNTDSYCSSVSYLKNKYTSDLKELEDDQSREILSILERLYEIENFTKTKEVIFLADKANNKLKILEILEEFDSLKNDFDKIDKQKIQCDSLIINSDKKTLEMDCISYSAWFEKGLRWFDGTTDSTVKWTSLSVANSFLNYIEKESDVFNIIDRQKIFSSEVVLGQKTDFTNQTPFKLKLEYNLQ